MSKITNSSRFTYSSPTTYLVASGNQNLAANDLPLFTTGNSMNVASGQLAIVNMQANNATYAVNDTINASLQTGAVEAFKIVQGTPASSNIALADNVFEAGHKTHVETQVMRRDNIYAISTTLPSVGTRASQLVTQTAKPQDSSLYSMYVQMFGESNDKNFGNNRNVVYKSFTTPSYASMATGVAIDHLYQNLITEVNKSSNATGVFGIKGTDSFLAFGIKLAGGVSGATTIGTLTAGSAVPYMTLNGVTYSYTLDAADVATMNAWIAASVGITATSQIVNVNITTTGSAANVDAIVVIALDEKIKAAYDTVSSKRHGIAINLGDNFVIEGKKATKVTSAKEEVNSSRNLLIDYERRAGTIVHTPQRLPNNDFFVTGKQYIQDNSWYTLTVISYYDTQTNSTGTFTDLHGKKAKIALPATVTVGNVTAGVSYATAASTTVSSLNTALGAWLSSASTTGQTTITYSGVATASAPFA